MRVPSYLGLSACIFPILPIAQALINPRRAELLSAASQEDRATSIGNNNTLILPPLPSKSNSPVSNSTPSFNLTTTADVKFSAPICTRWRDTQLNPRSCLDSYGGIAAALYALGRRTFTVGRRGLGIWDLNLPARFLSGKLLARPEEAKYPDGQ